MKLHPDQSEALEDIVVTGDHLDCYTVRGACWSGFFKVLCG